MRIEIPVVSRVVAGTLDNARLSLLIAIIAFLGLHLPAADSGLSNDDFLILSEIREGSNTFELYNFDKTLDGSKPWWSHEDHSLALFRPFSSLLSALDHKVLGDNYFLWHLQSISWGMGLLVGCWYLFCGTLSRRAASLAVMIVACSGFTSWSVDYLAQRNHLVSLTAGVWALHFYIQWRTGKARSGRMLSVAGLCVGLLGGEYCLTLVAYLLAFEAFQSRFSPRRFLSNTWPMLLVLLCYLVVIKVAGAGTYGLEGYLHPTSEPLEYLRNLPRRSVALVGLLWNLPIELSHHKGTVLGYAALSATILIGVYSCWRMSRSNDEDTRNDIGAISWYASGAALALLPLASTIPNVRLISCGAIGHAAVVGVLVSYYLAPGSGRGKPVWLMAYATYWLFFSFVYSPMYCISTARWLTRTGHVLQESYDAAIGSRAIEAGRQTVVVRAPSYHAALLLPRVGMGQGHGPSGYHVLTATYDPVHVRRVDTHTIEIDSDDGTLLSAFIGRFFRNSNPVNRFEMGERVSNSLFTAAIRELKDGFPKRIRFTFRIPVDDPSLQFAEWRNDRLVPIQIPRSDAGALLIESYDRGVLW